MFATNISHQLNTDRVNQLENKDVTVDGGETRKLLIVLKHRDRRWLHAQLKLNLVGILVPVNMQQRKLDNRKMSSSTQGGHIVFVWVNTPLLR